MSYTPDIPYAFAVRDMKYSCALRRISRGDFAKLQKHFLVDDEGNSTFTFGSDESYDLMDEAEQILPKYVTDWDGPAPIESVVSEVALMDVFANLFGELIKTANLQQDEEKNLDAPLSKSTAAQDTSGPRIGTEDSPSNSGSDASKPVVQDEVQDSPNTLGRMGKPTSNSQQ